MAQLVAEQEHVFPTLYKRDTRGKVRVWSVRVTTEATLSKIHLSSGLKDGALICPDPKIIKKGKNVGRANETTHAQQALAEAKSLWDRKKQDQYVENEKETTTVRAFRPMLADKLTPKSATFPMMAQPKLDGVRCNATKEHGAITLTSRTGHPFCNLNHIREELSQLDLSPTLVLDGELGSFGRDAKLTFQTTTGLVKRDASSVVDPREKDIDYVVFDLYDHAQPMMPYSERAALLEKIISKAGPHIKSCSSYGACGVVSSMEEANKALEHMVALNFEGLVLRQMSAPYEVDKRSKALLKFKKFIDEEFVITGFESAKGKDAGSVVFECVTAEGKHFAVRPEGTLAQRRAWFAKGAAFIGKPLTVRYFERTTDGVPRFPVGVVVRDYE